MSANDDRIQKILASKLEQAKEAAAAKVKADAELARKKALAEKTLEKWSADSAEIVSMLNSLQTKLAEIDFKLRFANDEALGGYTAWGVISGTISGKRLRLDLKLHKSSTLNVALIQEGRHPQSFSAINCRSILELDRGDYETLVLDAIEAI